MPMTTATETSPTRISGFRLTRRPRNAASAIGTTTAAMIGLTSSATPSSSPETISQGQRPVRWYSKAAATARIAGASAGTSASACREFRR